MKEYNVTLNYAVKVSDEEKFEDMVQWDMDFYGLTRKEAIKDLVVDLALFGIDSTPGEPDIFSFEDLEKKVKEV